MAVVEVPWVRVEAPKGASVKLGVPMVTGIVVLAVWDPDVPVTVIEAFPATAALVAETVSEVELVTRDGLRLAVTPAGKLETARFTLPVNPFLGTTLTEAAADCP